MSEFSVIANYFSTQTVSHRDIVLGIGDDAAICDVSSVKQLAISMDTLVEGVHFPKSTSAYDIGWKSLAVNLSDMAAMGARPLWFTLGITMPNADEPWLARFSQGMFAIANQFDVQLIGGDTTRGPLTITIQIAGDYTGQKKMQRSQAKVGDKIYVTGTLGDSALGLLSLTKPLPLSEDEKHPLLVKLNRPVPRVKEANVFASMVNAAIDISDGLAADLTHILQRSGVGAKVNVDSLPVSRAYCWCNEGAKRYDLALTGGDDYELCLTVAEECQEAFLRAAEELNCRVTEVGSVIETPGLFLVNAQQKPYVLNQSGYDHFYNEK